MLTNKVNMTFSDETVKHTKYLTETLQFRNRTAAVESALTLMDVIVRRLQNGGKLQIVDTNGSVETIIIPGLPNA